jgi:hypothetical protein
VADARHEIEKAAERTDIRKLVRLAWKHPEQSAGIDQALAEAVDRGKPGLSAEELFHVLTLPRRKPEWQAVQVVSKELGRRGPTKAPLAKWAAEQSSEEASHRAAAILAAAGDKAGARNLKSLASMHGGAEPSGIGGWLAFFMIPLALVPLSRIVSMVAAAAPVLAHVLRAPGAWVTGHSATSTTLVVLAWIWAVVAIVGGVSLLWLGISKRRVFRTLVPWYYPFMWITGIPRYVEGSYTHLTRSIVLDVITAVIWALYFLYSKRVRNTFVR